MAVGILPRKPPQTFEPRADFFELLSALTLVCEGALELKVELDLQNQHQKLQNRHKKCLVEL